ncbi:hypothetical protein [Myroides odoratimimus]|uniref:hypothetical protein n=1 Tax=Myroides odoratimimus TaxID=76832 RepID=UPI0025777DFF|nr:hypothetical protein [Myroides odoratimimus]MDM1452210.1 hypothetical protein [Myroides odoratimimus]MDM1475451.1 hypothetical protein [Myroides odoratimimus]MDM1488262.1 hypothetical protein [Myroides odoratimimus]MEC4083531.1 hypothetical protein [Myroides odoratimimus]
MKTVEQLRTELKNSLSELSHVNDGSLAAQVNENIQWAWDNWEEEVVKSFYTGDKPEKYNEDFMKDWIDNEDFDTELEQINNPA